ncbi:MAG: dihydroorotate dehydrogenase electron transfer subunit [Oscillospiraceae bacterium]|jgi:dihydroorotate dehydrogenase electron transfer subunit|nr:dihydroorotate dehydrogenase electron transfer subunit [Oscillospiraceae bacterium]
MKTQGIYEIKRNSKIADETFLISLYGSTGFGPKPGQFVNIKVNGFFLRRPISICDFTQNEILLIYKVFGKGTFALSKMGVGTRLDLLCGLGNGFNIDCATGKLLLLAGGVGVPPIYFLAKNLAKRDAEFETILGFKSSKQAFFLKEFESLGKLHIVTEDGSLGEKGFITEMIPRVNYDYYFACGPRAMLAAVHSISKKQGQISFEERMACGFGACMGCSIKTKYGAKKVCSEGPVFSSEEIIKF